MAQASIQVTPGSGPAVDFRTVGATPYYRQIVGLGDPSTDTGVAPVDATYGVGADIKRVVSDPFGANSDAKVVGDTAGSYSAKLRGINHLLNTGIPIFSLPSLNAGTNFIGRIAAGFGTDAIYNNTTSCTPKFATIAASSSGNNTIVAAVSSKKIRVLTGCLIANGTVNVKWQSGASGTDLTGLAYLIANAGYTMPFAPTGHFETGVNTLLNLNLSAAVAVGGWISYIEVA